VNPHLLVVAIRESFVSIPQFCNLFTSIQTVVVSLVKEIIRCGSVVLAWVDQFRYPCTVIGKDTMTLFIMS
jgi:hypothetical protein